MDFTVIDVETANADLSSICQIGVAQFKDGTLAHSWQTLVNPEDFFDPINVSIHRIDDKRVVGAPKFSEIHEVLGVYLSSQVVASHTTFDSCAIRAAYAKHGIETPVVPWLDTACVVRRAWDDRVRSGYGLEAMAAFLGIDFQHHDAVEDARAAGEILLHAIRRTGIPAADWLIHAKRPIGAKTGGPSERITREGKPDGPLFGEVLVFTGTLVVPRRVAADMAHEAGCEVAGDVTSKTTLLVIGDLDVRKPGGKPKSGKHLKAEAKIAAGQTIRILRESDFTAILRAAEAQERQAATHI